ncbi:glycoside hydrolase family 37 protein [Hebeloma cylindrosporum]|uniref:Trehalase n=1 Tax=Hebeloma cylindrosporum TaxID=76867 RepID=A0A0C2XZP3_HEBCY|nr:glycoside hydrolase family 37 protein [Hebeloma cylindrosporum h7]
MLVKIVTLALLIHRNVAQSSSGTATVPGVSTAPPVLTVTTEVPSASASLDSPLPSQAALPPKQAWCPSDIFCAGALLQTVNIAHLYPDDKTFVDKPTSKSAQAVLNDFKNISSSTTYGQVVNFVETDFTGEGLELQALALPNFNPSPPFLNNVTASLPKAFAQTVHGFWTQLIRGTNSSTLCGSSGKCESSLIPLNHTFVVPGGRFREIYYWDSFWIVEGLIESQLFDIVNDTLQNFMDQLDQFGFIPNGGRIYYLNRSQPPLFTHMLSRYVEATGDRSILTRALPLAEKELTWWNDNRSLRVKSPFSNKTFTMYHYAVNNSAPRPESYLTDYTTANDPTVTPALNETQKGSLYAELASGAETGWDYTMRWFSVGKEDEGLRSLNVRNTVAVDLNSILYKNHLLLASLYGSSAAAAARHTAAAASLKAGILDLFWDSQKLAFYDFILDTNNRSNVFSAAAFYPFWSGIIPDQVAQDEKSAFAVFSSVNMVLNRYNGTFPTTFVDTGLQWDAPNTWPPHQYIVLQALKSLPANVSKGALPAPSSNQSTFDLIPSGQLGLSESALPGQPIHEGSMATTNATSTGPSADLNAVNGTVLNGGTAVAGEGWSQKLQRELANRYFASALCSWHATGGSIPDVLPRLSDAELNVTQSITNTGNMFEKFSNLDIDSAGRGGEYTVQAGFGWTNGVLLWVASNYGSVLDAPNCPPLLAASTTGGTTHSAAARQAPRFIGISFLLGAVLSQVL